MTRMVDVAEVHVSRNRQHDVACQAKLGQSSTQFRGVLVRCSIRLQQAAVSRIQATLPAGKRTWLIWACPCPPVASSPSRR